MDEPVLRAMTRTLTHRGPDGEGYFFAPGVGLGHRRLAIVDPSDASAQPMRGSRGVITYNGEIYDHRSARARLDASGDRFRSSGDVEVLLRSLERHGIAGVRALRGMFAFGYWDERERTLLLARDRQGEKPLYYAPFGPGGREGVAFASELRALLAHPRVYGERAIDAGALGQFLLHEFVPAPRSIVAGVRKLRAGEQLVWSEARGLKLSSWDDAGHRTWPPPARRPTRSEDAGALVQELVRLGEESVRERLAADVPVGVFLSGGLDSSFVAACAARTGARVRTFSIGFEQPTFDETAHARAVARRIGSDHEEEILSQRVATELVPSALDFSDEPLADSSLLPTTLLARFASRQVKVALGGDGGDELLAGYPTFVVERLLPDGPLPRLATLLSAAADRLTVRDSDMPLAFKLQQASKGLSDRGARRHARFLAPVVPEELPAWLDSSWVPAATSAVWDAADHAAEGSMDGLDVATGFYLRCYLADGVLTKVDRATMRASLEARAPLLDGRFVRFCLSLAPSDRLRGLTTKWLLRRALVELGLSRIARRPKKGFGAPVAVWLRGPLEAVLRDTLSPGTVRRSGLLSPDNVSRAIDEHVSRRRDHGKKLWALLALMRWYEQWFTRPPAPRRV